MSKQKKSKGARDRRRQRDRNKNNQKAKGQIELETDWMISEVKDWAKFAHCDDLMDAVAKCVEDNRDRWKHMPNAHKGGVTAYLINNLVMKMVDFHVRHLLAEEAIKRKELWEADDERAVGGEADAGRAQQGDVPAGADAGVGDGDGQPERDTAGSAEGSPEDAGGSGAREDAGEATAEASAEPVPERAEAGAGDDPAGEDLADDGAGDDQ